jgi:hypothetical protein
MTDPNRLGSSIWLALVLLTSAVPAGAEVAASTLTCTDADADGYCDFEDCDDQAFGCTLDCSDADDDGVCGALDNCPDTSNSNQRMIGKLNGALVNGGDVNKVLVSPDGTRVVYLADLEVNERWELYSVRIGGGAPTKLNGPLVSAGDVATFALAPDGVNVVYRADQEVDQQVEIYSVPIGGGPAVKLNGPLVYPNEVVTFVLSADGTRVVYSAYQDMAGQLELYSVPIGGGTAIKLNAPMVSGGDVYAPFVYAPVGFSASPDSTRVVYLADQQKDEQFELYSVPIDGGTPVKLNGPMLFGDVTSFAVTPDSATVVFLSDDQESNVQIDVYSVPMQRVFLCRDSGQHHGRLPGGSAVGRTVRAVQRAHRWRDVHQAQRFVGRLGRRALLCRDPRQHARRLSSGSGGQRSNRAVRRTARRRDTGQAQRPADRRG